MENIEKSINIIDEGCHCYYECCCTIPNIDVNTLQEILKIMVSEIKALKTQVQNFEEEFEHLKEWALKKESFYKDKEEKEHYLRCLGSINQALPTDFSEYKINIREYGSPTTDYEALCDSICSELDAAEEHVVSYILQLTIEKNDDILTSIDVNLEFYYTHKTGSFINQGIDSITTSAETKTLFSNDLDNKKTIAFINRVYMAFITNYNNSDMIWGEIEESLTKNITLKTQVQNLKKNLI